MIASCMKYFPGMEIRSINEYLFFWLRLFFFLLIFTCKIQSQTTIITNENLPQLSSEDEIRGYKQKADSLVKINKIPQAEKWYELAYQKAKELQNDSLFIDIGHHYTLFLNWHVKNIPKAITINQTLQQLCEKKNNRNGLVGVYYSYGISACVKTEYADAVSFFTKAIDLIDETTSSRLKIRNHLQRGVMFFSVEEMEAARKDFYKALQYARNQDNIMLKVRALNAMGSTFTEKDGDTIKYYFTTIIDYCQKENIDTWWCVIAYTNLASYYLLIDQPLIAKKLIEENIDVNQSYADIFYSYGFCLRTLGKIHLMLGTYDIAIEKLKVAKNMALREKNYTEIKECINELSNAYEKMGDLKSSLETIRMIKPIMDTLGHQKIQAAVLRLENKQKLREKKKEVINLQKEKQNITLRISNMQFFSYILGILLLIGIFIYINSISVNRAKFYQLNEKVNHNRLILLQSSMNPHFLFNTFGTLQHFILKKEIKKANSYMTTLSELIRNVFASSNSIYIRFNSEIVILKSYIKLELGRFDHSFEVVFDIPKELTNNNPMIPSMILQPYVENAIIHGFSEKEGAKKLTLAFTRINAKSVQCVITDNGVGRKKIEEIQKDSKLKSKKNLSIATKNTLERLQIINKKDDQEGTILIQDLYDNDGNAMGTKVIIMLPIAESNPN